MRAWRGCIGRRNAGCGIRRVAARNVADGRRNRISGPRSGCRLKNRKSPSGRATSDGSLLPWFDLLTDHTIGREQEGRGEVIPEGVPDEIKVLEIVPRCVSFVTFVGG